MKSSSSKQMLSLDMHVVMEGEQEETNVARE